MRHDYKRSSLMIFGIGTDILDVSRLEKAIKKFDKKFISRIYGQQEIDIMNTKFKNSNLYLAKDLLLKKLFGKLLILIVVMGFHLKKLKH